MRWPWQRRASSGRHALPRERASWAQPALPPAEVAPPPSASVPLAPTPLAPAVPEAPARPIETVVYSVRLGFADGSELGLDGRHPNAKALQALAALLVQGSPK